MKREKQTGLHTSFQGGVQNADNKVKRKMSESRFTELIGKSKNQTNPNTDKHGINEKYSNYSNFAKNDFP